MKNTKKSRNKIIAVVCLALLFAYSVGSVAMTLAAPAEPAIILTEVAGLPVFTSNVSDTDLFANFKGVMPGDSLEQSIEIQTVAGLQYDYNIYLRARNSHEGEAGVAPTNDAHENGSYTNSADFMNYLIANNCITVRDDANAVLPIVSAGTDDAGVFLGRFARSGTTRTLTVTVEIPIEMGNDFQDAAAFIDWVFYTQSIDQVRPLDPYPTPNPTYPPNPTSPPVTTAVPTQVPEPEPEPAPTPVEEVTIDEEDTALGDFVGEDEEVMFEDEVPLADIPKTGDAGVAFWIILAVVSGGMMTFLLTDKKKAKI